MNEATIAEIRAIGPQASWQVTPTADHELFTQPGEANPTGHTMKDHGGPKLGTPKLFVLWAGGQSSLDKSQFLAFCKDLMESGYFDKIAPYTGGSFTGKFAGAADGPAPVSPFTLADANAYVAAAIVAGTAPVQDGNMVYSIMLPAGITATLDGSSNCTQFCAYHSDHLTVQPDTGCAGCHGNQTPFEAACMVESHEVAELCTDLYGSGWYEDSTGMENGDLVAWIALAYGPWTVQGYFGNEGGGSNLIGTYHATPAPQPQYEVNIGGPTAPIVEQPYIWAAVLIPATPGAVYGWTIDGKALNLPIATLGQTFHATGPHTIAVSVTVAGQQVASTSFGIVALAAQPQPQPCAPCRAPAQGLAIAAMNLAIVGWAVSDGSALSLAKWLGQYTGARQVYDASGSLPV